MMQGLFTVARRDLASRGLRGSWRWTHHSRVGAGPAVYGDDPVVEFNDEMEALFGSKPQEGRGFAGSVAAAGAAGGGRGNFHGSSLALHSESPSANSATMAPAVAHPWAGDARVQRVAEILLRFDVLEAGGLLAPAQAKQLRLQTLGIGRSGIGHRTFQEALFILHRAYPGDGGPFAKRCVELIAKPYS